MNGNEFLPFQSHHFKLTFIPRNFLIIKSNSLCSLLIFPVLSVAFFLEMLFLGGFYGMTRPGCFLWELLLCLHARSLALPSGPL